MPVTISDTAIEPKQPRRLEKKTNIVLIPLHALPRAGCGTAQSAGHAGRSHPVAA